MMGVRQFLSSAIDGWSEPEVSQPERLPWKDKRAISDLLFDVGMKYDVMFSFLCVPQGEWNGGIFTAFPIYKEILREGASVL